MDKISVEDGLAKYERWVFGRALRFTRQNWHDAEDLASETRMRALMQRNGWANSVLSFQSWLYGVMSNALKSFHWGTARAVGRHVDAVVFDTEYEESQQEVEPDQALIDMNLIIESLPYPEVAKLHGAGYTNQEMSKILGVNRVYVINRAKENRRHYMENLV